MKSLIFFIISMSAIGRAENVLNLDLKTVHPTQQEQIQSFLKETESALPQYLKNRLPKNIRVSFSNITQTPLQVPNCNQRVDSLSKAKSTKLIFNKALKSSKAVHIRYNDQVYSLVDKKLNIHLENDFISYISHRNSVQSFQCEHNNYYDLAKGALINAIAYIYTQKTNVVDSKYQVISGPWKKNTSTTGFWPRAINPYELAGTPEDHFAINLEYYLMDPDFACRKPLIHEFLQQRLQEDPLAAIRSCKVNTELRISRVYKYKDKEASALKTYDLNPDHVFNVYYLRASAAGGAGSFGHAMFRVVICPKGAPIDETCLESPQSDLVINPRANPLELRLDNMKGLFGGYPSQFLITALPEIRQEYGNMELRHLFNIPLGQTDSNGNFTEPLNEVQKKRFIYATLDQYWNYYGNYKFLTNNCADETMRLYQMTSDDPKVLKLNILKPFDVNKKLDKQGYLDQSQILPLEKEIGILGKVFGASNVPKNWEKYEQSREDISNSELTFQSRVFEIEEAIVNILKLECQLKTNQSCAQIVKNPKQLKKEMAKWLELATPQEINKNDEKESLNVSDERRKEILAATFAQVLSRYDFLMKNARSKEEQGQVVLWFYRIMFHIENKRAEQMGNESIQMAYDISYPNKDRTVRREKGVDYIVSASNVEVIRSAVDEYSKLQENMMPFKEMSVQGGYGIPLSKEVVRGEAYRELFLQEDESVEKVIESLKEQLGYDYILLKEVREFFFKLGQERDNRAL